MCLPDEGHVAFFQSDTIIASFLHLLELICKVSINHFSEHQFVVFLSAKKSKTKFFQLCKEVQKKKKKNTPIYFNTIYRI